MAANDFDGDGRSDVLWRRDDGAITNWLGAASGGFTGNDANAWAGVPTDWIIVGAGDFNGDGRSDLLWGNSRTHDFTDWLATPTGGWLGNQAAAYVHVPDPTEGVGWIGDFNGDGRDDILWVNENSEDRTIWLGRPDGGFDPSSLVNPPDGWHWEIHVGDFNGDGRDDLLWTDPRNGLSGEFVVGTALAGPDGQFAIHDGADNPLVARSWRVVGVGDFNGDGRDDLLWRDAGGALTDWLATDGGRFFVNDAAAYREVDTSWHVVAVGDYNGDGRADILWRNDSGAIADWLGAPDGGFAGDDANPSSVAAPQWRILPDLNDPTWPSPWDY